MSQHCLGPRKRRFSYSNYDDSEVSITYHHHTKRPTRSDCMACKGGTYCERPLRRSPLAQISANQKGHSKRRNTFYGCTECNVALCKEGLCFNRYHRISSNRLFSPKNGDFWISWIASFNWKSGTQADVQFCGSLRDTMARIPNSTLDKWNASCYCGAKMIWSETCSTTFPHG